MCLIACSIKFSIENTNILPNLTFDSSQSIIHKGYHVFALQLIMIVVIEFSLGKLMSHSPLKYKVDGKYHSFLKYMHQTMQYLFFDTCGPRGRPTCTCSEKLIENSINKIPFALRSYRFIEQTIVQRLTLPISIPTYQELHVCPNLEN